MPPIPRSAFEKDPRPGPLFEGNPVGEGTTRRGTDTPVHHPERPAGSTHSSTRGLKTPDNSRGKRGSLPQTRRGMTLLSQLCRDPVVGAETERKPEVPASPRGEALFRCARPSGVPRGPANFTGSLASQSTLGSSLRSPAEGEGNEGFSPPPEKVLESASSMRLEALVPSRDSRAMTRTTSPRAWRPDFPGAAREAP